MRRLRPVGMMVLADRLGGVVEVDAVEDDAADECIPRRLRITFWMLEDLPFEREEEPVLLSFFPFRSALLRAR